MMRYLNIRSFLMVTLIICLTTYFFVSPCHLFAASSVSDFEDGTLTTETGGEFQKYEGVPGDSDTRIQAIEVCDTFGAAKTNRALRLTVLEGNSTLYYLPKPGTKVLIPQASNADRLSFYIKLPENYPSGQDNNFHVGTYTRDPINGDLSQNGAHYYHYLNIPGTVNWTKVVCNKHPQHQVTVKTDPGNDPVMWGYYDGFTRFYLSALQKPETFPWEVYYDEVKFYNIDEPENDDTINSISCTYFGNGRFQIGWHGNSQYNHNNHRYEIRYSHSVITNKNYSSATIVPGGPFKLAVGSYNFIKADFTISIQEQGTCYFAIKDIDSSSPYVSKIDYEFDYSNSGDAIPPSVPTGINVNVQ